MTQAVEDFWFCVGFRMPASDSGATYTSGRRPKAAKERTRGGWSAENAAHSAMGIWLNVDPHPKRKPPKSRRPFRDFGESKLTSVPSLLAEPLAQLIHQTFPSEHTSLCAMIWFLR